MCNKGMTTHIGVRPPVAWPFLRSRTHDLLTACSSLSLSDRLIRLIPVAQNNASATTSLRRPFPISSYPRHLKGLKTWAQSAPPEADPLILAFEDKHQ